MNRAISVLVLPFLVVIAVIVASSVYIVDVREKALVLRFGEVVEVRENPGLGIKVPFIDSVVRYDARILGLPTRPMEVTPLDDRRLVVDAFARWQVLDAQRLYQATEGRGLPRAQERLDSIINDVIRRVLGSVPSTTVLSDDRTVVELTSEARKRAEVVRGEADARRNAVYAEAFGRDPEFFAFTRSMTSYERALKGENSSLVIQPEGEFFDYLRSDGADRANPVPRPAPTPSASAEDAAEPAPAAADTVAPTETTREGEPLGASSGVKLTPMPEALSSPPQEEPAVPAN